MKLTATRVHLLLWMGVFQPVRDRLCYYMEVACAKERQNENLNTVNGHTDGCQAK